MSTLAAGSPQVMRAIRELAPTDPGRYRPGLVRGRGRRCVHAAGARGRCVYAARRPGGTIVP